MSIALCAQKARYAQDNCEMKKETEEVGEYADFAERIEKAVKRVLTKQNPSIQDKATALGFSKSFMADVLKGRKMPSAPNIMDIAIRTGVRAEWLWTGRAPMIDKIAEGYLYIGDLEADQQNVLKLHAKSYKPH